MRSETFKSRKFLLISGLLILALALSLVLVKANPVKTEASAPSYDMTIGGADEAGAQINGAWWFAQPEAGISDEFLDYDGDPSERGYNTDGVQEFDEHPGKSVALSFAGSGMTPTEYSGDWYYEFQVDLNELGGDPYISLDEFQVWMTDNQNITGYNVGSDNGSGDGYFGGDAELIYDLDGGFDSIDPSDTWIGMDYNMGEGSSGAGEDYRVLIPVDSFDTGLEWVVLYVRMGLSTDTAHDWDAEAGSEQWGFVIYPGAPVPGIPDTLVSFVTPPTSVDIDEEFDLVIQEANTGMEGDTPGDVDLVGAYVLLSDGTETEKLEAGTSSVTLDSGTYTVLFSGDTSDSGVLNELETWTWTIQDVALGEGEDTTFTANGHGWVGTAGTEDDADDITYVNDFLGERATATVSVNPAPEPGDPSTEVTISATPEFVVDDSGEEVFLGGPVTLTITETNNGGVDLYEAYVVLDWVVDDQNLTEGTTVDQTGGTDDDGILSAGETWIWEVVKVVAVDTTFTANGHGWVNGTQGDPEEDISCDQGYCEERDRVTVPVVAPYTDVGISVPEEIMCSTDEACVFPGDEVTLTITEQNTGDQDLEDVRVEVENDVTADEWELTATSPAVVEFDGEDCAVTFSGDDGDGVLDVGETWSWTIAGVMLTEDTTFLALGYGYLEDGTEVSYDNGFDGEMEELTIYVVEPETCLTLNASGYLYMDVVGGIPTYYLYRGETLTLEILEDNVGNCDISNAHVVLDDGTTFVTLNDQTEGVVQDHVAEALWDNGILDYAAGDGERWYWEVPVAIVEDTTFTVNGYGVVLGEEISTANGYEDETDMINVVVMDRGTFLSICMETDVDSCGCTCGEAWVLNTDKQNTGTLVITEKNWGDVPLYEVEVCVTNDVTEDEWTLDWTVGDGVGENDYVEFTTTACCMDPCQGETSYVVNQYGVVFSGDTNEDGVLDPGEIWKWVVEDVEFCVDTVFTADGYAWDYGVLESQDDDVLVSYDEGFVCERDSVCIYIAGIHPSTLVHMCTVEDILYSDGRWVYPGETVTLTVTEENNGDVALTDAYVELKTVTGAGTEVQILDATTATESMTADGILEVGEVWTWTAEVVIEIDTVLVADGHGMVLCHDISYESGYMCERDKMLIEVVEPNTMLTITADPDTLDVSGTVTLTVTEVNIGNCDVSGAYVVIDNGTDSWVLDDATEVEDEVVSVTQIGGIADNGILDQGETWIWVLEVELSDDTTVTVNGYGHVLGVPVSYENGYLLEQDSVTISANNPDTQVAIHASDTTISAGEAIDLTITEENIGNCDLNGVYVVLGCGLGTAVLDEESTSVTINSVVYAVVFSGDTGDDGVLGVGEVWTWAIDGVVINVDTCITANAHGWVGTPGEEDDADDVSNENGFLCEYDSICINV